MVTTRRVEIGSGSGSGVGSQGGPAFPKDRIREIIREEVVAIVRVQIPEMFGSIKTAIMEFFGDRYASIAITTAATASVAVAAVCVGKGRIF